MNNIFKMEGNNQTPEFVDKTNYEVYLYEQFFAYL